MADHQQSQESRREQRIVSPPNVGGSRSSSNSNRGISTSTSTSKSLLTMTNANINTTSLSDAAALMPMSLPHQSLRYHPQPRMMMMPTSSHPQTSQPSSCHPPSTSTTTTWGQPYHHRYGPHHPPPPPPPYHGRRPAPGQFIFQAGPPAQHQQQQQQHVHRRPRGPHHNAPHYARPLQRPMYSYPPPPPHPHGHRQQQHHHLPKITIAHQHHRPVATHTTYAMPPKKSRSAQVVVVVVTPSNSMPNMALKRNIVSRGSSPTNTNATRNATIIQANANAATTNTNATDSTPAKNKIVAITPSANENADTQEGSGIGKHPNGLEGGGGDENEKKQEDDNLAAVDAIFAAAEVIAKRPSPSPPPHSNNHKEINHASTSFSPAIIHRAHPDSICMHPIGTTVPDPNIVSSANDTDTTTIITSSSSVIASCSSSTMNEAIDIDNDMDNAIDIATTPIISSQEVVLTPKPKKPFKKRKVASPTTEKSARTPPPKAKKVKVKKIKIKPSKSSNKSSSPTNNAATTPEQPTPTKSSASAEQDQYLADRALFLSQTIEAEPCLYRALLLHMALERETPRKPGGGAPDHNKACSSSTPLPPSSSTLPCSGNNGNNNSNNNSSTYHSPGGVSIGKKRGNQYVEGIRTPPTGTEGDGSKIVITDGFFWKDVPELESILQSFMEEYYEMSENRPQSKKQQQFNNRLVSIVYQTALQCGYTFDQLSFGRSKSSKAAAAAAQKKQKLPPKANKVSVALTITDNNFNHKKLRDRIRCYYKTHVQNSKKRLITLLKNPTRPKNREVLLKIVDDVKARASVGDGDGRRKLSPNGKAAINRLEVRERSLYVDQECDLVSSLDLTTPCRHAGQQQQQQQAGEVPSTASSVSHNSSTSTPSSSSIEEQWNLPASSSSKWHAPPSPRKVSMDVCHSRSNASEVPAPPAFASPCKPEHAAMLQSIRQVSVQL